MFDRPLTSTRFQTTNWQMILRARGSEEALSSLLESYWPPIYAYLRRRGYARDLAKDLTQDFIVNVVLRRDLLERADRSRGRFRSFLLGSLKNFCIDHKRRDRSRGLDRRLSLDEGMIDVVEDDTRHDRPMAAFERRWATSVLESTLEQLEQHCLASGLATHWEAFRLWVVLPATGRARPRDLDAVAQTVGADSPEQVSMMLQVVKRRFSRTLREIVAQTVESPEDIDDEVEFVRNILESA